MVVLIQWLSIYLNRQGHRHRLTHSLTHSLTDSQLEDRVIADTMQGPNVLCLKQVDVFAASLHFRMLFFYTLAKRLKKFTHFLSGDTFHPNDLTTVEDGWPTEHERGSSAFPR